MKRATQNLLVNWSALLVVGRTLGSQTQLLIQRTVFPRFLLAEHPCNLSERS